MKKLIYIGISLLFIFQLYSCNESYLDTVSTDSYNEANWWQTENQAISSINGCYSVMRNAQISQYEQLMEDNYTPNSYSHGGDVVLATGAHNPGNVASFRNKWDICYQGIGRTNNVLDNIDRVELSQTLSDRIKGEAHFLRAFYYSTLVNYFGGVPLILESPDFAEHSDLPRNTRQEVINQVLQDLDEAVSLLPVSYTGSNIGRATKGAALALKARILLYESRWADAVNAAKQVMDLNKYSLSPDYRGLFMVENENNSEIIFDVQYLVPEYAHSYDVYLEIQINAAPTLDMINSYLMKDGLPMDESPLYDPENPYENRDPRMHQTCVIPGYMFMGKPAVRSKYFSTGFGFKKYTSFKDNVAASSSSPGTNDINYIILRYADVLLMYAEAKNEDGGPDDSVYEAINEIRARADMPDVPEGLTKEQMREVIRHERRIELVMEGRYYHDIRRWRTAEVVMNANALNIEGDVVQTRSFNPARDYLWPLHEVTIQENPVLEQNPGY